MSTNATCWEDAYRVQTDRIAELRRENAALRAEIVSLRELTSTLGAPNHINVPVEQWRALRADKERLDWLARNRSVSSSERPLGVTPESLRDSIDAARKEAQP